jgi:CysZ protein
MFASLAKAIGNFFDGTLKGVILRSLGLTLLLFILLFAAVEFGIAHLPTLGAPWVNRLIEVLAPLLLLMAVFVLGAPVAAIFASLYLDRVARAVEARAYPNDPRAPGMSTSTAISAGARLAALALVLNLALALVDIEFIAVPALPEMLTILVNGWLLGREYFELAALRHMSRTAAQQLRRRHGGRVLAGGTVISLVSAFPIANLFAPLLGAAFMVHLMKRFMREEQPA